MAWQLAQFPQPRQMLLAVPPTDGTGCKESWEYPPWCIDRCTDTGQSGDMEFFAYQWPTRYPNHAEWLVGVRFADADRDLRPIFLHEFAGAKDAVEAFVRRLNDAVATWPVNEQSALNA